MGFHNTLTTFFRSILIKPDFRFTITIGKKINKALQVERIVTQSLHFNLIVCYKSNLYISTVNNKQLTVAPLKLVFNALL